MGTADRPAYWTLVHPPILVGLIVGSWLALAREKSVEYLGMEAVSKSQIGRATGVPTVP